MEKIAIIAVAYNRIDTLQRLLSSLESANYGNDSPTLIISIDKSQTESVEQFADDYNWKRGRKIVKKHDKNMGLHKHMMSLGNWFCEFDNLIVLEDDIVVSKSFYSYARQAISIYENNPTIAGISLYGFATNYQNHQSFTPVKDKYDGYFMNCAMSWGQVWMKKQWNEFYQWYTNNIEFKFTPNIPPCLFQWKKSWLKYHTRFCIENDKYFLFPYCSLSTNTGSAGTHSKNDDYTYQVPLQVGKNDFLLPTAPSTSICYDGFFENKALYAILGFSQEDLCLDISGSNGNLSKKRYWLTTKVDNYKIIKSFGLSYRPVEMNIINDYRGNDIFLYDTLIAENNPHTYKNRFFLYECNYPTIFYLIGIFGKKVLLRECFQTLKGFFRHK